MTPAPLPIDELRRKAKAATPGGWVLMPDLPAVAKQLGHPAKLYVDYAPGCKTWGTQDIADAAHIAAFCPSTALAILDRLAKAEADRDQALTRAQDAEKRLGEAEAAVSEAESYLLSCLVDCEAIGKPSTYMNGFIKGAFERLREAARVRAQHGGER